MKQQELNNWLNEEWDEVVSGITEHPDNTRLHRDLLERYRLLRTQFETRGYDTTKIRQYARQHPINRHFTIWPIIRY